MNHFIQDHASVACSILTTVIFQGTYIAMGVYMLLVYAQAKKRDYLLYGMYILLFGVYFFVRIDQVFETRFIVANEDVAFYITVPLLFLITGVYIDFINAFAEIGKYSPRYSREVSVFSRIMYVLTALMIVFSLVFSEAETLFRKHLGQVFMLVHLYAV